jgi:hypothetical protein
MLSIKCITGVQPSVATSLPPQQELQLYIPQAHHTYIHQQESQQCGILGVTKID